MFLSGALLSPLLLAACGGEQVDAAVPPQVNYGRDTCDRCGMIISDERFAGGLVAEDGTASLYDDIGEMLAVVREEGLNGRRAWVHDRNTRAWIDGTAATIVRGEPEITPMGTGFVAFGMRSDAEAFSAEHDGAIMNWQEATAPES
jgi:copper chaperone NosL